MKQALDSGKSVAIDNTRSLQLEGLCIIQALEPFSFFSLSPLRIRTRTHADSHAHAQPFTGCPR
jgi:hypothetical protein